MNVREQLIDSRDTTAERSRPLVWDESRRPYLDQTGEAAEIDRAFLRWFEARLGGADAEDAESAALNYSVALTLQFPTIPEPLCDNERAGAVPNTYWVEQPLDVDAVSNGRLISESFSRSGSFDLGDPGTVSYSWTNQLGFKIANAGDPAGAG
jgi:hypothetical protein